MRRKIAVPEPMRIIMERAAWDNNGPTPPAPRSPCWREKDIDTAAEYYGRANNSDPFAAARMRLHLSRCLQRPDDILKDSLTLINVRQAAIIAQEAKRREVVAAWEARNGG